jgi:two-component system C4-dicarboxylate transport sensor histidine kinase DctB
VTATEPSEETLLGLNRAATVARLLSGAIHDVNNALMVISGTIDIMDARPDVPPTMHDALARLRAQSARAATTLNQVQTFTRAERAGHEPLNFRELVDQALALRDFAIRRARLAARFDVEGTTPFVVVGNRGDLQQAVLNLLINAEQALATTQGAIALHLSREGETLVLRVADDGAGVTLTPPERAFEPFVTSRAAFEFAGLGLWAARRIAEAHGGMLTQEAASNGAIFTLRLPAARLARRAEPEIRNQETGLR